MFTRLSKPQPAIAIIGSVTRMKATGVWLGFTLGFIVRIQLKKLLRQPVIHVDETSIRVNKVNYWIHVYTSEEISLQFVHEKR